MLVVEVGPSPAGAYAGRLFAGYGAEVVAIGPGPTGSGSAFYDGSKRRLPSGSPEATQALTDADVVIRSRADGPLEPPVDVRPGPSRCIEVTITPFSPGGPYASWRSSDLVDAAIGGHLRLTGDPGREPLQGVPDLVLHAAGAAAFVGAMAALVARARVGVVQQVAVSHHEVLVALHQFTLLRYSHAGAGLQRHGNRYAGPGAVVQAYRCRDGWISLALATEDQVERMLHATGLIELLDRPDVDSITDLAVDTELLNSALEPYLAQQDQAELVELWQALRLPIAPISTLSQVLDDDHLEHRGYWVDDTDRSLRLPGAPVRIGSAGWAASPSRRLGSLPDGDEPIEALGNGPLTGTRVLDLTRVWAGPLAARILADLGADVLCVETPWTRCPREVPDSYVQATHYFPDDEPGPDPWNRMGFHNKYAINKRSMVLALDEPDGQALFRRLVPSADVVIENYSPRVMPEFGLDEQALHRLNPDLVYVTMPGYGRSGPNTDWVAYGPTIDGHVGHADLIGYSGEGPWKCGIAWPDPVGGLHAAAGALVALLDRLVDPDSGGQTVEVAQVESAATMIGQHLVATQVDGPPSRVGNRRAGRAPQGVYPCAGTDRWIALSVLDDEAWGATCRVLGLDQGLATLDLAGREAAHDQLDRALAAATVGWNDTELMHRLQEAGVAAAAVADAADLLADPHLAATDYLVELDHPSAGTHPWPRLPIRLSATPATMRTPAPLMGADNETIAGQLGGLSAAEIADLTDRGILRSEPPS